MFFFVFKQQWSCAKINVEVRPTERGGLIPEVNPYHQNKGFQIVRMESNGYNLRFMSCHIIYSLYHQSCSLLPAAIDRESNPCCFLVSSTGKNCTSVFHGFLRVWRSLWLYCTENKWDGWNATRYLLYDKSRNYFFSYWLLLLHSERQICVLKSKSIIFLWCITKNWYRGKMSNIKIRIVWSVVKHSLNLVLNYPPPPPPTNNVKVAVSVLFWKCLREGVYFAELDTAVAELSRLIGVDRGTAWDPPLLRSCKHGNIWRKGQFDSWRKEEVSSKQVFHSKVRLPDTWSSPGVTYCSCCCCF